MMRCGDVVVVRNGGLWCKVEKVKLVKSEM